MWEGVNVLKAHLVVFILKINRYELCKYIFVCVLCLFSLSLSLSLSPTLVSLSVL